MDSINKMESTLESRDSSKSQITKLVLPSFSSFNPEYKDPNTKKRELELQELLQQQDKQDREFRKEKRSKKKHKKEIKKFKERESGSRNYFIDTKEVKHNIVYGNVHGSAIPEYNRQSNVIYGDCNWRIDFKASKTVSYVVVYSTLLSRDSIDVSNVKRYQRFKDVLKLRPIKVNKTFLKQDQITKDSTDLDYIPLPAHILDTRETQSSMDMDLDSDSFKLDSEYTESSKQLQTKLELDPYNILIWLEFIRLQDKLLSFDAFGKKKKSRVILEKKLSIFEKALDHNPNEAQLISGYMEIYQQLHDVGSTLNKWDDVLYENPYTICLWRLYLEFRMSQYSSFTVSDVLQVFEECLLSLGSDPDEDGIKIQNNLLSILVLICHFLVQSGYIEKAIALFQGMIEFNCFCPLAYKQQSFEQRIDLFEDFWEKDVARFGQRGATGWANSLFKESTDEPTLLPTPDLCILESDDQVVKWIKNERHSEFSFWEPLIGNDVGDVQDPFRMVLFEDIKPFIFEIPDLKEELITEFIQFLGFPMSFSELNSMNIPNMYSFWKTTSSSLFDYPLHSPCPTFGLYCQESDWFSPFGMEQVEFVNNCGVYKKEFLRNVFTILKEIPEFQSRFLYPSLVFEASFDYKYAYKYAKSLLKVDRDNLLLWNALGHLELKRGKSVEAIRIYSTAIEASKASHALKDEFIPSVLYTSLAQVYFQSGEKSFGVSVICSFVDGAELTMEPTPIRILRARQELNTRIQESLSKYKEEQHLEFVNLYHLYLLLEYHSSDSIKVVLDYTLELSNNLVNHQKLLQGIYEGLGKILYYYFKTPGYQPKLVRQGLEQGLRLFPQNTLLLSLYGWTESQMHLENRVRRFLDLELSLNPNNINQWIFFIWSEYHQKSNMNVHYIRSLFDRALETPRLQVCGQLWNLYIDFEIQQENWQKVKSLLFQSIRSCPWYKELYVKCAMCCRLFESDELRQIMTLMSDKEVRSRFIFDF